MNWFGRCARLAAAVCLVAGGALSCTESDDDGNADFTDRPGQNAPTDQSGPSSSTVTTTDSGGMGTAGDPTSGQVGE